MYCKNKSRFKLVQLQGVIYMLFSFNRSNIEKTKQAVFISL